MSRLESLTLVELREQLVDAEWVGENRRLFGERVSRAMSAIRSALIHFHTVGNGQKIRTLQAILAYSFVQSASDDMLGTPCVEQRNFAASIAQ